MPTRFFYVNRTPEQIADEGLAAIRKMLLDDAMSGEMAFLTDGREYVVRFRRPDPQPVNGNPALLQIQLIIEWTVGNYAQAKLGEYVHGELLRPDYKGLDEQGQRVPSNEATRGTKVFRAEAQGWHRVS